MGSEMCIRDSAVVAVADGDLDALVSEIGQIQGAVVDIGVSIADGDLDALGGEIGQLAGTVLDLGLAVADGDLDALAAEISALDGSTIDVALAVDSSGLDEVSSGLAEASASAGLLGGSIGAIPGINPATLGIGATTAAFGGLISAANDFDAGIREVATLQVPDLGIEEATAIMEEFAQITGENATDNIPALYNAISAGIPPDNALEFLVQSTQLASAGAAELEPTVGVLTGAINAYGAELGPLEGATNALFGAVQTGVTTIPELAAGLGQVTPLAAALGVNFNDLNAAVATSTQVTGNTASSITGLRGLLAELGTSTSAAGSAFLDISGQSLPQFIEAGGSLADALQLMTQRADETGIGVNELFGSVEAGGVALQLTRDNGEAFASTMQSINATVEEGAAVSNAFEINQASLGATFDRVLNSLQQVGISLVSSLLPGLQSAADFVLTSLIPAFESFLSNIGPVFDQATSIISGFLENIDFASFEATALEVFGAISAGITDTFASIDVESLSATFGSIFDGLRDAAETILPAIPPLVAQIGTIVSEVVNLAVAFWNTFGESITQFVVGNIEIVINILGGLLEVISGVISTVTALLNGDWSAAWAGAGQIVSGVFEVIEGVIGGAIERIVLAVNILLDLFRVDAQVTFGGFSDLVLSLIHI